MEVSGCGRRAYIAAGLGVTLSAVMAVVGVLAAFILYAFSGGLTAAWLLAITAVFTLPALSPPLLAAAARLCLVTCITHAQYRQNSPPGIVTGRRALCLYPTRSLALYVGTARGVPARPYKLTTT